MSSYQKKLQTPLAIAIQKECYKVLTHKKGACHLGDLFKAYGMDVYRLEDGLAQEKMELENYPL